MSHLICLASDTPLEAMSDPHKRSDACITIDTKTGTVTAPPEDYWDVWPMRFPPRARSEKQYFAEVQWPRSAPGRTEILTDYLRRHLERAEAVELWNLWDGDDVELVRVHRETFSLAALTPEKLSAFCEKDVVHPALLAGTEVWHQHCLCIIR